MGHMSTEVDDAGPHSAADFAACAPSGTSYAAAGALTVSGVAFLLMGLQTWVIVPKPTLLAKGCIGAMLLCGAALAYLGARQLSVRTSAALGGLVVSSVSGSFAFFWLSFSAQHGFFSALATSLPFACLVGALLSFAALDPARKADAARRRMLARGETLGV
jgi:hypothetical protein